MVHDAVHKSVQRCQSGDEVVGLLLLGRDLRFVPDGDRYSANFDGVRPSLGRDGGHPHDALKLRLVTQQEDWYRCAD